MRIRLITLFILSINSISGTVYDLKTSLVKALLLEEEGYFTGIFKNPLVLAAIRDRLNQLERLCDNWVHLTNAIDSNKLSGIDREPFFKDLQRGLWDILHCRTLGGEWRRFLANIYIKMGQFNSTLTKPLTDFKEEILELKKQWDSFFPKDFVFEEFCRHETIANIKEIRKRLAHIYKLNNANSDVADSLLATWRAVNFPVRSICEILRLYSGGLEHLRLLFDESSSVHKYVDGRATAGMDYLAVALGEIGRLAREKHEISIVLEDLKDFHSLKGFKDDTPYHRCKAHYQHEAILNLAMQLAFHLKGVERPNLLLDIHTEYTRPEKADYTHRRDLESIFMIYLWSLGSGSKNQKYLEVSILTDEASKTQLKQLIKVSLERLVRLIGFGGTLSHIDGSELERLKLDADNLKKIIADVENLEKISDLDRIIEIFNWAITREIGLTIYREARLGYIGGEKGFGDTLEVGLLSRPNRLRGSLTTFYSKEVLEYLRKEMNALESSDDIDLNAMYKRLRLFQVRMNDGFQVPVNKATLQEIIGAISTQSSTAGDFMSLYHKYVFSALDYPVDQIRKYIDNIIKDIKSFLRATKSRDFKNDPELFEITEGGKSLHDWFLETAPFLHGIKDRFDLITFFPGVKLSPFEQKLYDLAERIHFVGSDGDNVMPKNIDDWDQVTLAFQEWLLLLESWKVVIEARNEQDILDPNFQPSLDQIVLENSQ